MKMYDYLIAYKCSRKGYLTTCDATISISRTKRISTFEDVADVIKFIAEHDKEASNIGIYNIILLGRNEH